MGECEGDRSKNQAKYRRRVSWYRSEIHESKLKVKCLCHSLFSMKFPWSLFTLTNQSRSWDLVGTCILYIAFYIFDDSWISAPQIQWRCCCHCHAVLPVLGSSVILSSVKMCLVYKEALLILTYSLREGRMKSVRRRVAKSQKRFKNIWELTRGRYSELISRFVPFKKVTKYKA